MQSRNVDVNSAGSNKTNGFTKDIHNTSLNRNNDDYLDIVLRKEINLWFQKNSSTENETSIIEPTNDFPFNNAPSVINLGYSGE